MWHPDSYETQYTNETLTIAVNGLSLEKNWCDPKRIPLWAFENVGRLLQAAEKVRARPTKFNMMDYFPWYKYLGSGCPKLDVGSPNDLGLKWELE